MRYPLSHQIGATSLRASILSVAGRDRLSASLDVEISRAERNKCLL